MYCGTCITVVLVCKCPSSIFWRYPFPDINVDINIFSVKKCNIDSSAPGSSCKQIKINKSQKRTKNFPCQSKQICTVRQIGILTVAW